MTTNRLTAERPFAAYCVLAIDGRVLYEGDSLSRVAEAWVAGTTYGAGADAQEAWEWAEASRVDLLARRYTANGRAAK